MKIPFRDHHLLQLLEEYKQSQYPLDLFVSFYFKDHPALGSKDRYEISETVYALLRWKGLLEYLCPYPKTWDNQLKVYKEKFPFTDLPEGIPDHIAVSFPEELFNALVKCYGREEAMRLCLVCNARAPTTIRVNTLKTTREALLKKWASTFDISPCPYSSTGIIFNKKIHFFSLPEFKNGLFEIQDEASQLVAQKVEAKPGDLVLDFCAGSGGKTLAFAPQLEGKGQIFLHDIRPRSLIEAKKRMKRAGIQNFQIVDNLNALKKNMDWVLVDAPCSGTGTLRRNPDMKWRFQEEDVKQLIGKQRSIFEKALSFLKPGGCIVFATCSILHDENELQAEHFMNTYSLTTQGTPFKSLPSVGGMDGFYAIVLKKEIPHV